MPECERADAGVGAAVASGVAEEGDAAPDEPEPVLVWQSPAVLSMPFSIHPKLMAPPLAEVVAVQQLTARSA